MCEREKIVSQVARYWGGGGEERGLGSEAKVGRRGGRNKF